MKIRNLLLCVVVLSLGACASTSTKLVSTWADPDAAAFKPRKILVTVPAVETARRLSAELRMTQLIPNSVTSTSTFINGEEGDEARVRARIKELGIDAVVILRPVAVETTVDHVPPSVTTYPTYGGAYGYWGSGYATVYDPGYTTERTVATVETSVYAVEGEKLLWISRSQTIEPQDVSSSVDQIIEANVEAMREQGLISR